MRNLYRDKMRCFFVYYLIQCCVFREALEVMKKFYGDALSENTTAQMACFGMGKNELHLNFELLWN